MGHKYSIWNKHAVLIGILPGLIIYVCFALIPALATAVFSFTDITGVPGLEWKFVGLDNYKDILFRQNSRDLKMYILNTVKFSVIITIVQMILSLLIALLLNIKSRFITAVRAIVFMPQILGLTLTALSWKAVLNPMDGPMKAVFDFVGIQSNFLSDPHQALYWIIIIQIWLGMGFSVVVFLAGLQNISSDLFEAASVDGATGFQRFFHITLPLIWPQVRVNAFVMIVGTLSNYQTIYVLTNGEYNTMTLGMKMFDVGFNSSRQQGYAAAISMILFLLVSVVTVVTQTIIKKKENDL